MEYITSRQDNADQHHRAAPWQHAQLTSGPANGHAAV